MTLTLVILAAGMGSRYGGLKQLDEVGPQGETVMDFSVADAQRAGFNRVLFVIRRDFEAAFRGQIGTRYAGRLPVDYVFQSLDALPAGFSPPAERVKPWGTGHAVWCARDALTGPFAVINADDFYGYDSFAKLAAFLRETATGATTPPRFAMVGFRLANTLSENGAVSRGVCEVDGAGQLLRVEERTGILADQVGAGRTYSGQEIVSMNCWGFTPALFPLLDRRFDQFLAAHSRETKAEFYLPASVSAMIGEREATVSVLPTRASWFGVTYREDKPRVVAALQALIASGELKSQASRGDQ